MFRRKKKWSDWKDVCAGRFQETFYCLQYRRRITGEVEFRVASNKKGYWAQGALELESLCNS